MPVRPRTKLGTTPLASFVMDCLQMTGLGPRPALFVSRGQAALILSPGPAARATLRFECPLQLLGGAGSLRGPGKTSSIYLEGRTASGRKWGVILILSQRIYSLLYPLGFVGLMMHEHFIPLD